MCSILHPFLPDFILNGRVKASFLGDLCWRKGIYIMTVDYHAENSVEHSLWKCVLGSVQDLCVSNSVFHWPKYFTCFPLIRGC